MVHDVDTATGVHRESPGEQLRELISEVLQAAKVRSHIHSSNPDIEASIRADSTEGYVSSSIMRQPSQKRPCAWAI